MKTKNMLRFATVCLLSIFVLACASKKEDTIESSDELTFNEFDDLTTEDEIAADETADDEMDIDDAENLETDMPDLPGDEQIEDMVEIDEIIVEEAEEPVTYQKPPAYKPAKPYSRAGIGYPDNPISGTSSDGTYIVKKGDSLWAISKRNDISVRDLAAANGMSIKVPIKIGQKLIIPGKSKPAESSSPATSAKPSVDPTGKTYTVVSGDSYYRIGKKLGVNYLKLMNFNNDTEKSILQPGQVIKVP